MHILLKIIVCRVFIVKGGCSAGHRHLLYIETERELSYKERSIMLDELFGLNRQSIGTSRLRQSRAKDD